MINICLFCGNLNKGGGTQRMTQILSNVLITEKKYRIYCLSLGGYENNTYYHFQQKIKLEYLKVKPIKNKVANILNIIISLHKFIKHNKIDILINVDTCLGIFTLPNKLITPKLKIINWEMFSIHDNVGTRWIKTIRQLSLYFSNAYVCLTKYDLQQFKNKFKIHTKLVHIYNPNTTELNNSYNKESKRIISVGNFFRVKGFDMAIKVANLVLLKHPKWEWHFYGDGIELDSIKKEVNEQVKNQIYFDGRVKDINNAYKEAAIFVMTSRLEAFGLVLLEAKANLLPIVAYNVPSSTQEIINCNSGFLIPPFDINLMAEKINYLIENNDYRLKCSHNSQNNLSIFSIDKFKNKWIELIESII